MGSDTCDVLGLPPEKCSHCLGRAYDPTAQAEVERLRAENARLREVLIAVAARLKANVIYCENCHGLMIELWGP